MNFPPSLLQIEGGIYCFFLQWASEWRFQSRQGDVSANMARWTFKGMTSAAAGRALGWVKARSNSRGRFLELSFSLKGKLGTSVGASWASIVRAS